MSVTFRKQFVFLSAIVASISAVIPALSVASEFSFEEAWQELLQQNNSLKAEQADVAHYQHLQKATRSYSFPSVSVGANYIRLDQDVTLSGGQILESTGEEIPTAIGMMLYSYGLDLGAITSTLSERDIIHASINAIWPIFTGGRIKAAKSAAEWKTEEAKSRLEMAKQDRFEDLSRYYFSVILASQVLDTRIAVEKGLTHHRDNAIKLEEHAQIAHVERLQADASLAQAVVERKKAEKNLEIARSALTEILNQSEPVTPNALLFINRTLPPLDSFISQTLETYPGLAVLNAKEKQAENLVKAKKGTFLPEVLLYGNYNLYEDDSLTSQLTPDWMMGVGVNFSILDRNGRVGEVRAASSLVTRVNHLRAQAIQDLQVLVKKTYLEAEMAIEEVDGLNASLDLAKENLDLRRKAFNQGLASSLDVVDAELYLASVRTQQAAAGFKYLTALNGLLALSSNMEGFSSYLQTALPLNTAEPTESAE